MPWTSNFSAAMSADPPPSLAPADVEAALAAVRRSQPGDYDGHTGFEQMTPDARLKWLESAVRFVQSSKPAPRPAAHGA